MKYNGFYFWMFKGSMKKVLEEKYGRAYAAQIMKMSKSVYRQLVERADNIGGDNPMAYNELFALAFVAPYIASGKKIPPETVQGMMRRWPIRSSTRTAPISARARTPRAQRLQWRCTPSLKRRQSKSDTIGT